MPIDPSMDGKGQKSESPAQRALRIAWLKEAVASGNYFVPAEVVARSLLRRLELHDQGVGIFDLGLLPQPPSEAQIVNSGNGREELPGLLQKLRSLGLAEAVLQADQYHVANHGSDVSLAKGCCKIQASAPCGARPGAVRTWQI